MAGTFKNSWLWLWPWIRSYCIPSCITHRPLPTCQISLKSKKLFVDGRTHVRMYARTDRHLRPALLSQLCRRDDLKINYILKYCNKVKGRKGASVPVQHHSLHVLFASCYRDHVTVKNSYHLLPNPHVLVTIRKGVWVVKLCFNQILQFFNQIVWFFMRVQLKWV